MEKTLKAKEALEEESQKWVEREKHISILEVKFDTADKIISELKSEKEELEMKVSSLEGCLKASENNASTLKSEQSELV